MNDQNEFPLWFAIANWWLQHKRRARDTRKPWLPDTIWVCLLKDCRGSLPVPHGRLEKWVTERMMVWIDQQEARCNERAQVNIIKIMIKSQF